MKKDSETQSSRTMKITPKRCFVIAAILLVATICFLNFYSFSFRPFAVYSESDGSLTFYSRIVQPKNGSYYDGKIATYVYSDVNNEPSCEGASYLDYEEKDWIHGSYRGSVTAVSFADPVNFDDCTRLFSNLTNCESIDIANLSTDSCTNFSYMFSGCDNVAELDLRNLSFNEGTSFQSMFSGCAKLETILFEDADFSSGESFGHMFEGCKKLTTLELTCIDFRSGNNFEYMFQDCFSLSFDCSDWDVSQASSAIGFAPTSNNIVQPNWSSTCTTANSSRFDYGSSNSLSTSGLTRKLTDERQWDGMRASRQYREYSYYNAEGDLVGVKTIWNDGTESTWISDKYEDEYHNLPD